MTASLNLWIGLDNLTWEFDWRTVRVDAPGIWTQTVSIWVREHGLIALKLQVAPVVVPIEILCIESGALVRRTWDRFNSWGPAEPVNVQEIP